MRFSSTFERSVALTRAAAAAVFICAFVYAFAANIHLARADQSLQALSVKVMALHREGKAKDAISLARTLTKRVRTRYGAKHPQYGLALNNLALLHDEQGRPYDAEPVYRKAAAVLEKSLGARAPLVGMVVNNLAASVFAQCRLDDAEVLFLKALDIQKPALGPNHPDVLAVSRNLTGIRNLQNASILSGGQQLTSYAPAKATKAGTLQLPPACAA